MSEGVPVYERPAHIPPPGLWTRFRRHKLAVISIAVVALMTAMCAAAPLLTGYEFDAIDLGSIREAPSLDHWMGTDDLGRDLFTRILYGGRVSILIGVLSAVIGTLLGSTVGSVAGFYGGRLDNVVMRTTDVA